METAWAELFVKIDEDDLPAVRTVLAVRPDAVVSARNEARSLDFHHVSQAGETLLLAAIRQRRTHIAQYIISIDGDLNETDDVSANCSIAQLASD